MMTSKKRDLHKCRGNKERRETLSGINAICQFVAYVNRETKICEKENVFNHNFTIFLSSSSLSLSRGSHMTLLLQIKHQKCRKSIRKNAFF